MFDRYVAFQAALNPEAPAMIVPRGHLSFRRLEEEIAAAARLGCLRGCGPIAVAIEDPVEHWIALLALARLRIASTPPGHGRFELRALDRPAAPPDPVPEDAAYGRLLVTSATTGPPRGVALSWAMIDAGIRNALLAYGMPDGIWVPATGTQTILGFVITLAAWASGNPVLLGGGEPTPRLLASWPPALIACVPAQLRRLAGEMDRPHHGRLRFIVGGGSVPPPLAEQAAAMLGSDLRGVYGATETGSLTVCPFPVMRARGGAAGHVLPDVAMRIVDPAGAIVPAGMAGEICVRGARVATGYVDDAAATAARFRDGWFHTGDVGRLEPDGLLIVEGRTDEILNFGGAKISPGWIEAAALGCAGVEDAAVIVGQDASGIDLCHLALVTSGSLDEAALGAALHEQTRAVRRIEWRVVPEIPRNAMGKVDRSALRRALGITPRSG